MNIVVARLLLLTAGSMTTDPSIRDGAGLLLLILSPVIALLFGMLTYGGQREYVRYRGHRVPERQVWGFGACVCVALSVIWWLLVPTWLLFPAALIMALGTPLVSSIAGRVFTWPQPLAQPYLLTDAQWRGLEWPQRRWWSLAWWLALLAAFFLDDIVHIPPIIHAVQMMLTGLILGPIAIIVGSKQLTRRNRMLNEAERRAAE